MSDDEYLISMLEGGQKRISASLSPWLGMQAARALKTAG